MFYRADWLSFVVDFYTYMNQREIAWGLVQALMRSPGLGTKAVGVGVRGGVRIITGVPRINSK